MNQVVKNILRFVALMAFQVLVLNQLEIGLGIQLMVYPLFILLLPVEMSISSVNSAITNITRF